MGPQVVFVCASAYQAGWLQSHEAQEALIRWGARRLHHGQWLLANGTIVKFVVVNGNAVEEMQYTDYRSEVILLFTDRDIIPEEGYYFYAFLEQLALQRGVQVVHAHQLPQQLQERWTYEAINRQLVAPEKDGDLEDPFSLSSVRLP